MFKDSFERKKYVNVNIFCWIEYNFESDIIFLGENQWFDIEYKPLKREEN